MSYQINNILYNSTHNVELITKHNCNSSRTILVKVTMLNKFLQIKLRDANDFSFNYTTNVDSPIFDQMKAEQCLEIGYNEFHIHLVDLLKQTSSKGMLLRLEQNDQHCKMVFYERSKIKSLIFLIVRLDPTDQREIIDELTRSVALLKETNANADAHVSSLKCQMREKDVLLSAALTSNHHAEKQFLGDVKRVEEVFVRNVDAVGANLNAKIGRLCKRHEKLTRDVEILKRGCAFKESLYSQTLLELDNLKRENLINVNTIDNLRKEIFCLNDQMCRNDKVISEQRDDIVGKTKEIENLNSNIGELKKDVQEAAKIIAQKTKTHDEIAKDLVQANTMLVNFTNQYDVMRDEIERLKRVIAAQERSVEEQRSRAAKEKDDFDAYRKEFNVQAFGALEGELRRSRERIEELEKQNREVTKINGLLTKKLASGDGFEARRVNLK